MIVEVKSINHFDKLARDWNCPENKFFWTHQSCRRGRNFDPDSIEKYLKSLLISTLQTGEILPYVKMWSYEENGASLAGCAFTGMKNFMMNEKIFEEVLWQMPGKYPTSMKDKKIMIKLLQTAENYARKAGFKVMSISRDPMLHNFTKEKNSGISNYYTRNNYEAGSIQYYKTLN